ncbi:MAG: hypothetical protein GTO24_11645, partial [candidate division Zixibacteria bacterium]|nr:hypothetical protein [candidate division Zixibacteria bacterium]
MLKILIIVSVLIWFLILLFLISQRGFVLLLIWLLIAPVVSNLVNRPGSNPFFKTTPVTQSKPRGHAYITYETTIRPRDLLEPTRLIFIVFLVLFLAGYVADRKRLGALDTTEILMCAFSFILIASVLFQSRRLAFGLHVVADAFVVPFLGYFIARKLVTSEDRLRKLMKVMGYLGLYLIVISLIERLTHQEVLYRLTGPFESIHMFYVVMTVVFFVMFLDSMSSQGFAGEQAVPRSIRRFVLYMSPVIIFLNWTRGGWAGFLLGLWVFLFLGRRQVNFLQKLGAVGSVLILLPVTAAGVYALQPQEIIEERIANVSNVYARLGAWRIIIQEAIKRPILGIGLNNLRDELYESRVRYAGVRSETTSHN